MILVTGHQGDILFIKVDRPLVPLYSGLLTAPPAEVAPDRIVLGLGETTGHVHGIANPAPLASAVFFGDIAELNVNHPRMTPPSAETILELLAPDTDGGYRSFFKSDNRPTITPDQLIAQLVVSDETLAVVAHDEHRPVALTPGVWIVARQRQWSALDNNFHAALD